MQVETATARYQLRAVYVGVATLGVGDTVIVAAERLTPELPAPTQLVDRYSLTAREAEITLLLAQGLANQEIARRLGLSPHTVRHHAEWVFAKLSVRSRKTLELKLLGWEAE